MKKPSISIFILISIAIFSLHYVAFSQPDYVNFQAVIRDANGKIVPNKEVAIQIKLFKNTDTFLVERHVTTTNANGIAMIAIGSGNSSKGSYKNIDWLNGPDSIRVRYDKNGGSNYADVGTSKLLSVPYALFAKNAANVPNYTAGNGIAIKNNVITNLKPDTTISLTAGNGIKISGNYPAFTIESTATSGETTLIAGDGIEIDDNHIINTKPDKIVNLTAGLGITIEGTYPNFNISTAANSIGLKPIDSTNILIKGTMQPVSDFSDTNLNVTGSHLLWFGDKAAFRAGWTGDDALSGISGNVWNCDSIGCYSAAFGKNNTAKGFQSFAVGKNNRATANNSFVAGLGNKVLANNSAAFGENNSITASNSFATGNANFIFSTNSFATGWNNELHATNAFATGSSNIINGNGSSALGSDNIVDGESAFAVGGFNYASGDASMAAGLHSRATGQYSFAIGDNAIASGEASFALGRKANTNGKDGSFVLADGHIDSILASDTNQMTMRFTGGYRLFTNLTTRGVTLNSNAWATSSDSTLKENFIQANGSLFLTNIANMKLGSWNYKDDNPATMRHYGAMAQDIFSAFGKDELGIIGNDTTINSADMDGIMMIAIKELILQNQRKDNEINNLKMEIQYLKQVINEIKEKIK